MSARFSLPQCDNYSSTAGCCLRRVFAVATSSRHRHSPPKLTAAVHRLPFATLTTRWLDSSRIFENIRSILNVFERNSSFY
jgi:hypothetical protein